MIQSSSGFFIGLLLTCSLTFGTARAADQPPASCNLTRVAQIPAKMQDGNLLIETQIAGRPGWMKIGTRDAYSLISRQMAEQLKQRVHDRRGLRVRDEANEAFTHMVQVQSFTLGALEVTDFTFFMQGENSAQPLPWDGIIGVDILANYDVEIDAAHGMVSLFSPNHCGGRAAYWTQDFQTIPFTLQSSELDFQVLLENKAVKATLDTASADTTLTPQAADDLFALAADANATIPDGKKITSTGIAMPFHHHRFACLEIGGVGFRNTEIGIISEKMRSSLDAEGLVNIDRVVRHSPPTPLAIGMHHLAHLRLLIAYGEGLIYVSAADAH